MGSAGKRATELIDKGQQDAQQEMECEGESQHHPAIPGLLLAALAVVVNGQEHTGKAKTVGVKVFL